MNSTKYLVPIAISVIAMLTLTGSVYAYSASYSDSFDGQALDEEYILITGDHNTLTAQTLTAVWDSATVYDKDNTKFVTTYSDGHFVKDMDKTTGATTTTVTYKLNNITVKKYNDANTSGTPVSGLTEANFSLTTPVVADGATSAVAAEGIAFTVAETGTGTGVYTVSVTFTLITLGNTAEDVAKEYVIPGYTLSVSYTAAEKA